MRRKLASAAFCMAALVSLAACGSAGGSQTSTDTSVAVDEGKVNHDSSSMIVFPQGFTNVAFKCNGHDGVYLTSDGSQISVVPNDPECAR